MDVKSSSELKWLNDLPLKIKVAGKFDLNEVVVDGKPLPLKRSLKVMNHSPTGFNWGYSGSGPAQFALALLLKYMDKEIAIRYYQDFKFKHIAALPQTDFTWECNFRDEMIKLVDAK